MYLDLDYEFLDSLLVTLDAHLTSLSLETHPDPDTYGLCDRFEYIVGLGLVACQGYLTSTAASAGVPKRQALDLGPCARCGLTLVKLVNEGANYWKHSAEWNLDSPLDKRTERTASIVAAANGHEYTDYPLSGLLFHIVTPGEIRLSGLLPLLRQWTTRLG